MKIAEQQRAKKLRSEGRSIKDIAQTLNVSKASVSLWVRNIELSQTQRKLLSRKGHSVEVIEKRRKSRLAREEEKRAAIMNEASRNIAYISEKELFLTGIALYWAEGGKTRRGPIRLANGDPAIIQTMMRFFREICKVPESKFRGHIHIHPHLDYKEAELYWSLIANIPLSQFFKTYRKPNKSSSNKKDTLPYGTFEIYVCDTQLFFRMKGWIQGLTKQLFISKDI